MFVKRELTKQWRAEEKIHNERVRQMREDEAPLTRERLMKMKQLTTEEAHMDEWMWAPVLVAANRDRHRINFAKAKLWGKMHNQPVFVPCAMVHCDADPYTPH